MGTDIHAAVESRQDGVWVASEFPNKWYGQWEGEPKMTASLHMSRDYDLGDVRPRGSGILALSAAAHAEAGSALGPGECQVSDEL